MTYIVIAIIAVLALIVIAVCASAAARRYSHYLAGMWVGNPKFLDKAGLRDFQLFLSPEDGGERQGYLLVTDADGHFVANQAITWEGGRIGWAAALGASAGTQGDVCTAENARIGYDQADPGLLPETMKVSLSILDGTLTLFDDEKVYAFLEKDHAASTAAVEMYAGAGEGEARGGTAAAPP